MSRIIIVLLSELLYIETFKNKSCGFETHSLKKENHGFLFFVYPWFLQVGSFLPCRPMDRLFKKKVIQKTKKTKVEKPKPHALDP